MRSFASLIAYLAGVSAILSIGIIGLIALQSPTERTPSPPTVAAASYKDRLAKPTKKPIDDQKAVHRNQKHKTVNVTRKHPQTPSLAAGLNAYGYADEPRRVDPNRYRTW